MSDHPYQQIIAGRWLRSMELLFLYYPKENYTDLADVVEDLPPGVTEVIVSPHKINELFVVISGPKDSPYENGVFNLKIILPHDYPNSHPSVYFLTRIYHPSINENGKLNLALFDYWIPTTRMRDVLCNVIEAMKEPDILYPKNMEAWLQYVNEYTTYFDTAKEWTKEYAMIFV